MANRRRRVDEPYEEYRQDLRMIANLERVRKRNGKWVWRTFWPIDRIDNLPQGAQLYTRPRDPITMVHSFVKINDLNPYKGGQRYIKMVPYHNAEKPSREERREIRSERLKEIRNERLKEVQAREEHPPRNRESGDG